MGVAGQRGDDSFAAAQDLPANPIIRAPQKPRVAASPADLKNHPKTQHQKSLFGNEGAKDTGVVNFAAGHSLSRS